MCWWARLAFHMPGVANFLTQTPLLSDLAKLVIGVAPQRRLPVFAPQTFKDWFHQRCPRNLGSPRVILWPDTFNNYLRPETAKTAVEVLDPAAFHLGLPHHSLSSVHPL